MDLNKTPLLHHPFDLPRTPTSLKFTEILLIYSTLIHHHTKTNRQIHLTVLKSDLAEPNFVFTNYSRGLIKSKETTT